MSFHFLFSFLLSHYIGASQYRTEDRTGQYRTGQNTEDTTGDRTKDTTEDKTEDMTGQGTEDRRHRTGTEDRRRKTGNSG